MTFSSERRSFEKDLLKVLPTKLKGSRWKKKQNAIFCELLGFYFDVFVSVFVNDRKTTFAMSAKPMTLDTHYWNITGLEANNSQPLSFRSWGAFTCPGLPLSRESIPDEGMGADVLARKLLEWADSQVETALHRLRAESFSSAVARHPNHVERGTYAITYVTSLIAEGNFKAARQAAVAYADGSVKSAHKQRHLGRDFHEIAVDWIDSLSVG